MYDNVQKAIAFVLPTNLGEALIVLVAVLLFPFVGRGAAAAGRADADPLGQPDRDGDARAAARGRGARAGADAPPAAPARSAGAAESGVAVAHDPHRAADGPADGASRRAPRCCGACAAQRRRPDDRGDHDRALPGRLPARVPLAAALARSRCGSADNPWAWAGIGGGAGAPGAFIYAPPLQDVFGSAPLEPRGWLLALAAAAHRAAGRRGREVVARCATR